MSQYRDDYNYDREAPAPRRAPADRPRSSGGRSTGGNVRGGSGSSRGGSGGGRRPSAPKRRSDGGFALPRGIGIAAAAMAALLVIAFLFQQYGGGDTRTVSASSNITGNMIEGSPIRITEVMSSNSSALADEDGDYPDWIELKNVSDQPVSLGGYLLSDSVTKDKFFPLPDVTLDAGAYMVVFASGKSRATAGQNIHTSFKLSSSGETLYLLDDMSNLLDIVEIPSMGGNYSYARDLTTNTWTVTDKYTPGYPNEEQYYDQLRQLQVATDSALIINEICASNKTILADEDGEYSDWIEIYNSGSEAVNLKGYALSDSSSKPFKWKFPDVTIEPGAYMVVFASGKSRTDGQYLHTSFSLSSEKSEVLLTSPNGTILDWVTYDLIPHDSTYGRNESGQWQTYAQGTPGYANTQQAMAIFEQQLSARNDTGLFIEEALASNSQSTDSNPDAYDWLELHNRSDQTIDLSGYGLSDNPNNPRKWQFPEGTSIAAGERMVILCSGLDKQSSGTYHTNFRISHLGETLTLCKPDGTIVDKLPMDLQYTDVSFGRLSDQSGFFYLKTPTPGARNSGDAAYGRVSDVSFSVDGGIVSDTVTLEMSCDDPNAAIYYTLDAKDPTTSSTQYTGPISISSTTVVRAVAVRDGYLDSFTHSATYFYGISHTVPIVSIVTDPDNLFDYNKGIMVMGPNATSEFPYGSRGTGANFWMDWEYPAGLEYIDETGSLVINQDIGIALMGQYSRAEDQKAIAMYARSKYGNATMDFNPFPQLNFTQYHALVVRASGQDGKYTRLRDAVLTSLADGTGVLHQSARPVVVYLNGEYWGHYNLRERVNKWFIAQHEGITDKAQIRNIDIIKGNKRVLNGSFDSFQEILDFVADNSLTNADNLQWVADRVDIDNYLTYVAMEMLVANTDTGNIKFYRVPGGKWKWIFFDLDWASFDMSYNYVNRYLNDKGHGVRKMFNNTLIRALLKNPDVRDQFLTKIADLMKGNFSNANIEAKVNEYKAMIDPEMDAQFEKWGGSRNKWEQYINTFLSNIKGNKKTLINDLKDYFDLSSSEISAYFGEVDMN